MTGEFSGDDPQQQRSAMLGAIENAIINEDYDFATQVADSQEIIKPFELIEYLDVKRRSSEDPVASRRWGDGLIHYLEFIQDQEFPEQEAEAINAVVQRLEFDSVVENDAIVPEPPIESGHWDKEATEEPDWDNDTFSPEGLTEGEIEKLANTPMGNALGSKADDALRYADGQYLQAAVKVLDSLPLHQSNKLRQLLDVYVMKYAEVKAQEALYYSDAQYLSDAVKNMAKYASGDSAIAIMKRCFDKHVYRLAELKLEAAARYKDTSYVKEAVEIVGTYGSSEKRIDAMLTHLGLA